MSFIPDMTWCRAELYPDARAGQWFFYGESDECGCIFAANRRRTAGLWVQGSRAGVVSQRFILASASAVEETVSSLTGLELSSSPVSAQYSIQILFSDSATVQ